MAELSYTKLTDNQIAASLTGLQGWSVQNGALTKLFALPSYTAGLVFACAIGHLAEGLNHHPDLLVGYGKVRVVLVTHDAGGGLTEYDFELARRIEKLAG
ncbi:MAG TPA: 4a-hydroxytetrahydrobiopterin dehydratase [Fimbriimonadaceae bacterium]|mgnify:CR=1 FL=1|nr:4a-hydroxytetrahydrobiopterin dehydratase [Fimbriimonadaceae bacterium]